MIARRALVCCTLARAAPCPEAAATCADWSNCDGSWTAASRSPLGPCQPSQEPRRCFAGTYAPISARPDAETDHPMTRATLALPTAGCREARVTALIRPRTPQTRAGQVMPKPRAHGLQKEHIGRCRASTRDDARPAARTAAHTTHPGSTQACNERLRRTFLAIALPPLPRLLPLPSLPDSLSNTLSLDACSRSAELQAHFWKRGKILL